jgi:phosphatidylinositol-3-phosphatase
MHDAATPRSLRSPERRRSFTLTRAAIVLALVLGCTLAGASTAEAKAKFRLPKIHHVFVILLENQGYSATFGNPSADPYLASTLPSQGALLENYFATGHESNDNYVSLVSGQPPNPDNQGDCLTYGNFPVAKTEPGGLEAGAGCVYPADIENIGTQLSHAGLSWKGYMQDMGNNPKRESAACGHPPLESKDETQSAEPGDGYATRHDPFPYFHSVIDSQEFCNAHVVALGSSTGAMPAGALPGETGLATDLKKVRTTPAFSLITPNLCADGHDAPPCKNEKTPTGATALTDIDSFLETWVPKITGSKAFRKNGLLEVVFDEAGSSETGACCGEMPGPSNSMPGIGGPGGGRVGAVLISRFIKPGTVVTTSYNHYSSLASWETLFGLSRLADAATVTSTFGADVYTKAK